MFPEMFDISAIQRAEYGELLRHKCISLITLA